MREKIITTEIRFRLRNEDVEILNELAKKYGLTKSGVLRLLLTKAYEDEKK